MGGFGYGYAVGKARPLRGGFAPAMSLSSASIAGNAPDNEMVGRVSGGSGSYTLVDDAGGRFKLIGGDLRRAGTASLGSGPHSVTVSDGTISKTFAIVVTAATPLNAVQFNGSTDYYSLAASLLRSGSIALVARVEWTPDLAGTSTQTMYSAGGFTANDSIQFGINEPSAAANPSRPFIAIKSGANTRQILTGTTAIPTDGTPTCIIGVYDSTGAHSSPAAQKQLRLYSIPVSTLTEVQQATLATGTNINSFTEAAGVRIGSLGSGTSRLFKGRILSVHTLNVSLSAQERLNLARGYTPAQLGLAASSSYVFADATATIADASGNGNTATRSGAPVQTGTALFAPVANTVVLTPRGNKSVSQRYFPGEGDTTKGPVTAAGFVYGAPAPLEARLVNYATGAVITDWQVVHANPANGAILATCPNIAFDAAWGRIEWRQGKAVASDVHKHGIGLVVLDLGQSNDAREFEQNNFAVAANDNIGIVTDQDQVWGDISAYATLLGTNAPAAPGDGVATFGNALIAGGVGRVAIIKGAVGGTGMPQWTKPTGANYVNAIACVMRNTLDGRIGAVSWNQGEADTGAGAPTDYATRLAFNNNLIDWIKTDLVTPGTSYRWFIFRTLNYATGSVDVGAWAAIKRADRQVTLDRAEAVFAGEWLDTPDDGSGLHFSDYRIPSRNEALALLTSLGMPGYYGAVGPTIASIIEISPTVTRVIFNLPPGATSLYAASAYVRGFDVTQDDFAGLLAVSNAAIVSATAVDVTHAAKTAGTRKLRYAYGSNPNRTNLLYDDYNAGLGNARRLAMSQQVGIAA